MRTNGFKIKQQKENGEEIKKTTNTINKEQIDGFLNILQQLYYKNYVVKHTFYDKNMTAKLQPKKFLEKKQQQPRRNISTNIAIKYYKNTVLNMYFTHIVFSKKYTGNFLKTYRLIQHDMFLEVSTINNQLMGIHIPSKYLLPHKKLKSYYVKNNKNLLLTQHNLQKINNNILITKIEHYQYISLSWMNSSLIAIHIHMGNNLLNN